MNDPDSSGGNDPDVWQGLQGAAHLADMATRLVRGRDPRMRDKVDVAGQANVKDLFSAFAADTGTETVEPHADLRDTEKGVEVVVDTSGTPVDATELDVSVSGTDATVFEPQSGYEASVSTEKPVEDTTIDVTDSQLASIHLAFKGGNDQYEAPEAPEPSHDDPAPSPPEDGGVPTLREFLSENPYMREKFESMVGPEMMEMAVSMYGDTPMDEIPLEKVMGGMQPDTGNSKDSTDSASLSGGMADAEDSGGDEGFSFGDISGGN